MNTKLKLLLEALPHDTRPMVEQMWNRLPADVRREAELTLGSFIKLARKNPASVVDLLKLLQRSAAPILAKPSRIAIVGPVNVGKSTLYNALVHRPEEKAQASPVPGTTRSTQSSHTGLFELVDTPGADHGGEAGGKEREIAFRAAADADFLLVVFDAAGSVTAADRALYRSLKELGKPHLVVLNKIDLIPNSQVKSVRESAARILDVSLEAVLPVSAQHSSGVEHLVLEVTAADPSLLITVAENLPALRRRLGWQAIRRAAVLSALVGLSPLPLTDLVPLTLIQGNMVLTLAHIYGNTLTFKRVLELVSTFGAGWLARLLFQEMAKFGSLPGWVLSASIAASATVSIGFAALTWFETGLMPDKQQVDAQARSMQSKFKEALGRLGKSRPSKKRVTEELEKLLPDDLPEAAKEAAPADPPESAEQTSPPPDPPPAPQPDETK